jgi:hypothetical protein
MHLLDLPDEILQLCCPETDLGKVRLACKRFAILSSKPLFTHISLLPTTKSAEKLRSILSDESLAPLVESLTLQASILGPGFREPDELAPTWNVDLGLDGGSEDNLSDNEHEYGIDSDDYGVLPTGIRAEGNYLRPSK